MTDPGIKHEISMKKLGSTDIGMTKKKNYL